MSLPISLSTVTLFSAQSMGSNVSSATQNVGEAGLLSVQHVWTGTPTGNIITEASNDGTNFSTVNTQAAGGVAGNSIYTESRVGYKFVRVRYAFTSGSGSLTSIINTKRI